MLACQIISQRIGDGIFKQWLFCICDNFFSSPPKYWRWSKSHSTPKGIDLQYKPHEFHSFFYNSTFSRQKKVSNTYLTIRAKRADIALSWSSSITSFYFKEIQRSSKRKNTPILCWVPHIWHNVVMNQTSKFDINTTQNFPLIRLL